VIHYMLDTDICIYIIKKRSALVLNKLELLLPEQILISSVTIGELIYGVEKSEQREKNHSALKNFMQPFTISSFDADAALELGKIRAHLEKKGQIIGIFDLMIAAQARALDVILVTNNEREFRRVPELRVENWTK